MKPLALSLLVVSTLSVHAEDLQPRLEKIAARIEGVTGIAAIHLESGRRVAINGGEAFPMASVYKLPIAIVTLRNVDAGKLSLDQRIAIEPAQYNTGHSPLREETGGKRAEFTLRRLIEAMVSVSDNTACDVLIGMNGGAAEVTRSLAMPNIRVDRTELEQQHDVDQGGAAGFLKDKRDTATPEAMADLLVRVQTRKLGLSDTSHEVLVAAMRGTSTGPNRIRAGIPASAVVANKTGTWRAGANDVAIITSPDSRQHVVLAVFTKGGKVTTTRREEVIAAISREVYREFVKQ